MRAGSEEWFNRWSADLKLTEAQKEKIRALQKEQRDQADKIRQDTGLTPEQRREKMRALREENDKKMKEILTAEQYQKWQELRQSRPGAANRGPGQGPGAAGERPRRGPRANTQ
jgi:Spy/CpxP family protein refolding chaperone